MAQESGILLEVSDNGTSGWTQLASLPAGTTSYQHTGLTPGVAKYYRAKALGNGSTTTDSAYTAVVSNATSDGALFSDYFEGAAGAVDSSKWTRRGASSQVTFAKDGTGRLRLESTGGGTGTAYDDALVSIPTFGDCYVEFPLVTSVHTANVFYFGFEVDADNYVVLSRKTDAATYANARYLQKLAGTTTYTDSSPVVAIDGRWRIKRQGNVFTFSKSNDNGATWQDVHSRTAAIGASAKIMLGVAAAGDTRLQFMDYLKVMPL
ncbi:hypothetical protein [Pontibacter mangrovi]|uniref:DUF1349 domain-containing protein n=1 Tax=Pontibacter mangrovi TaxID=2589816 RepID=A0A501WCJ1_9BACT|nr:hypothetical protein [Pontibacter mangrovi]TPE44941.1 hypothetical protein FJM65_07965 [Pontibacter mangrovi]